MKKFCLIILFVCFSILNSYAISFKPDYSMRLRYTLFDIENHDNYNTSYIRFRNTLGLKTSFDTDSNYNFYIKLLNENYYYFYNTKFALDDYKINEFVFDNIYFETKNLFNNLLNIKIGRQNLIGYGENFLISDGTPLDGSRTSYFNAIKLNFVLPVFNFDVIGHLGTLYDQYLPVFNQNNPSTKLNSDYEQSIMLFGKSNFSKEICLEPYYIYKSEENQNSYKQVNTFGGYAKYNKNNFSIRTQLAIQVKEEQNKQSNAFGGYAFMDNSNILFKDKLTIGGVYLSGNKLDTKQNEGWNNLFSRAVAFIKSDMLGLLYVSETGVYGYWTNLQLYNVEYNVNITKKLSASISYNLLYANETVEGEFFGTGKNRGNLTLAGIYYSINEHIKTTLYGEYFCAGDFYNKNLIKNGTFFKAEISMSF